jgi:two-component system, OmpR family, response regulator CpxR
VNSLKSVVSESGPTNRNDRPCSAADRRSILLISEDARIAGLVSEALECHGFSVSCESNVGQAVGRCKNGSYCLVLADAAAGGVAFPQLVRNIRHHSRIPLIVIAAGREPMDEVRLLENGADDFIRRPTNCDALIARVRALLRRTDLYCGHAVQAGNLRLDPGARVVLADSHRIDCTSIEYDILEYLARQAGQVVSRDKLVLDVCGRHATPFDRALDVHISHLRRKLRHVGQRIVTVRGIGYMLAATAADGGGP